MSNDLLNEFCPTVHIGNIYSQFHCYLESEHTLIRLSVLFASHKSLTKSIINRFQTIFQHSSQLEGQHHEGTPKVGQSAHCVRTDFMIHELKDLNLIAVIVNTKVNVKTPPTNLNLRLSSKFLSQQNLLKLMYLLRSTPTPLVVIWSRSRNSCLINSSQTLTPIERPVKQITITSFEAQ